MIFEKLLIPDLCPKGFEKVTPEIVKKMGGRVLLCDIDNTLVTYDDAYPTDAVVKWIENMQACGVKIAFVSNNDEQRVKTFNSRLGLTAFAKAGKPKTEFLKRAIIEEGMEIKDAVLLGDQLLTDCAAAKRLGIPAIIVPPIKDKKTLFFKFKRWLEIPYMKKYKKKYAEIQKATQ